MKIGPYLKFLAFIKQKGRATRKEVTKRFYFGYSEERVNGAIDILIKANKLEEEDDGYLYAVED